MRLRRNPEKIAEKGAIGIFVMGGSVKEAARGMTVCRGVFRSCVPADDAATGCWA
jgi:hypothetical protein